MSRELSAASMHCLPNSAQESVAGIELFALNSVCLLLAGLEFLGRRESSRSCDWGSSGVEEAFGVPLSGRGVAVIETGVRGIFLG